jgi:hypothetical protein
MLKLRVVDTYLETRRGEKNGRPWSITSQPNCFLEIDGEVRKFPVNIEDGKPAYNPGMYTFDGEKLLTVGRYGLEVDRFKSLNLQAIVATESAKPLFATK